MSEKLNTNDNNLAAINFASRFLFGKSYLELLNFLAYMGELLINVYDMQEENESKKKEIADEKPKAVPISVPIGFQAA
ncbi:MAG: hypothetical protein A3J63_02435 [Candidatus Moranbacteria bacterium RIFCSPHIGHO2_02_FULL_40_12b]|nr:MAG: hypothetical protein A3J63_02435 [Candidatus Moranbacteria bacterium RIFCSPHIGHO2_02_FULL_40_12b]OGI23767.1 MAG: hypothetical protein A3E91_02965 [Candidatus Moranbacteria bacterium RIFCSPHIGHO2_12_FULL_40_10]